MSVGYSIIKFNVANEIIDISLPIFFTIPLR